MTRVAIEQLLVLLNLSFDGENAHSLLGNIRDVRPADWDWAPPGGDRTIRQILEHAAIAKHLYTEHMFGAARRSYDDLRAAGPGQRAPRDDDALIAWARAGHEAFTAGVAAMDDADLSATTRRHYGAIATKASVIGAMIQHDCYHAGEINHLRALCQRDDAWWSGPSTEQS
jgi:uncharacterized damage-inducible protein DinB